LSSIHTSQIELNDQVQVVRAFTPRPELEVPLGATRPLPCFKDSIVDLELGCGTGMFALNYAEQHQARHLIAIEQTVTKFKTFSRAVELHQPHNLTPVHADAALWVERYVPKHSIERLFILYPNPYPKKKHRNLRWHYMPAMHAILNVMQPGSVVTLCTNLRWLVDEAAAQFQRGWKLDLVSFETIQLGSRAPLTRFEKKYLQRGEMCFELQLRVPGR
jgi:tRNA (guanine-N7-)-methyltransferase